MENILHKTGFFYFQPTYKVLKIISLTFIICVPISYLRNVHILRNTLFYRFLIYLTLSEFLTLTYSILYCIKGEKFDDDFPLLWYRHLSSHTPQILKVFKSVLTFIKSSNFFKSFTNFYRIQLDDSWRLLK